ncbi:hypothetical protein LJR258_006800 [Rhizobium sp. LjRoot258]
MAIAELIDTAESGTETAYERFNQQASSKAQTCLYRLRFERKQRGELRRRHTADDASHEHDAQLIGQFIYGPFQDVSDDTVGHLAFLLSETSRRHTS